MALRLAEKVVEFLQQSPNERFTAREIAEWVMDRYPNQCEEKIRKSRATKIPINDRESLSQQIVAEISGYRPRLEKRGIKTTGESPRRYYSTESSDSGAIKRVEPPVQSPDANVQSPPATVQPRHTVAKKHNFTEKDMYPKLSAFLWSELSVYSKRIDEKRSKKNKGVKGNHWLHPDLVGLKNLSDGWDDKVRECASGRKNEWSTLWSFEVKKEITNSDVREIFAQTVMNSSWANFGYLVAADIKEKALEELHILTRQHGIGLIKLDYDNPADNSEILVYARDRNNINWDVVNRLFDQNPDFKEYIGLVLDFYKTGKTFRRNWLYHSAISDDFD